MWPQLHGAHDSCTAIASQGDNKVVTVGEDGGIHLLQVEYRTPLLTIGETELHTFINIPKIYYNLL